MLYSKISSQCRPLLEGVSNYFDWFFPQATLRPIWFRIVIIYYTYHIITECIHKLYVWQLPQKYNNNNKV